MRRGRGVRFEVNDPTTFSFAVGRHGSTRRLAIRRSRCIC